MNVAVIVAVHVNGNATVVVIGPVDGSERAWRREGSTSPFRTVDPSEHRGRSRQDRARRQGAVRRDCQESALESAAHLDVMKIEELVDDEQHALGAGLIDRVVAMLTKMIDP